YLVFTPPATPEIYTLSLHDALPISSSCGDTPTDSIEVGAHHAVVLRIVKQKGVVAVARFDFRIGHVVAVGYERFHDFARAGRREDRKSTRLNSSHRTISYAVFCLKK